MCSGYFSKSRAKQHPRVKYVPETALYCQKRAHLLQQNICLVETAAETENRRNGASERHIGASTSRACC